MTPETQRIIDNHYWNTAGGPMDYHRERMSIINAYESSILQKQEWENEPKSKLSLLMIAEKGAVIKEIEASYPVHNKVWRPDNGPFTFK